MLTFCMLEIQFNNSVGEKTFFFQIINKMNAGAVNSHLFSHSYGHTSSLLMSINCAEYFFSAFLKIWSLYLRKAQIGVSLFIGSCETKIEFKTINIRSTLNLPVKYTFFVFCKYLPFSLSISLFPFRSDQFIFQEFSIILFMNDSPCNLRNSSVECHHFISFVSVRKKVNLYNNNNKNHRSYCIWCNQFEGAIKSKDFLQKRGVGGVYTVWAVRYNNLSQGSWWKV